MIKKINKHSKMNVFSMLCLLTLSLFMVACDETPPRDPEMYIIPDGYIGTFHIVYNVTDGQPKKMQDGFRVYEIPENGVLLTQTGINSGWLDTKLIHFYYRKSNGELQDLTDRYTTRVANTPESRAESSTTIYGGGLGSAEYRFIPCVLVSKLFHIGTNKDILDGENHVELQNVDVIKNINCTGLEANSLYNPDLEP